MRLPILALLAGMTVAACSKPKPDIQHMTVSGTPAITASTAPAEADKATEKLGLELLAKGDKYGWSVCDDAGHSIRALAAKSQIMKNNQ